MKNLMARVASDFWTHGCVTHGAALAFYALFVLVPVPILVISGVAEVVGSDAARSEVVDVLRALTGEQMAATLGQALETASGLGGGQGARLFALGSLIFGATAFFVELQDVLNKIWDVPSSLEWKSFFRSRLFSFVMVAASGTVLLALTLAGTLARGLGERVKEVLPVPAAAFGAGGVLVALLVIAALFGLAFRFVPDAEVAFRDVWLGSLVTALLFVGGNELIGFYLQYATLASVYGAAGSLVVTLIWIYYSALAFLFGAELTRSLGRGIFARSSLPRNRPDA